MTARGNGIPVVVNGKPVVASVDADNTWRQGHLALQLFSPATVVRFRRIEIKELPK